MATKSIVATKVGMTQVWDEDGHIVPVTVLRVQPCRVVQIKTPEQDGYSALQVTYGQRDPRKLTMPAAGHFAAAGVDAGEQLVELRIDDVTGYEINQIIAADTFAAGDRVDITGVSKGKGFAGAMKRHGFAGAPASHGAHRNHRKPGAIGACATPSRVFRGQRMAGRMGNEKVTTLNLTVVEADAEREVILVRGSVPGPKKSTVLVRNAVKATVAANDQKGAS